MKKPANSYRCAFAFRALLASSGFACAVLLLSPQPAFSNTIPSVVDIKAFAEFNGSWTCTQAATPDSGTAKTPVTTWKFEPLDAGNTWTRVSYGDFGNAIVGYNPSLGAWVYEDFHTAGSYAALQSSGPWFGTWNWHGKYYFAKRSKPVVIKKLSWEWDGRNKFSMLVFSSADATKPSSSQTCNRQS